MWAVLAVSAAACSSGGGAPAGGADDGGASNTGGVCSPGDTRSCNKDGCAAGHETCIPNGTAWSVCVCDGSSDGGANGTGNGAGSGTMDAEAPDAAPPVACNEATMPEPPAVQDAGGNRRFVAVMSDLSYGDASTIVGFDLGEPGCTAAMDPAPSDCTVDNSLGRLVATDGDASPKAVSEVITNGDVSLLIRVREYNGKADDDSVAVDLLIAPPFDSVTPDTTPTFDGTDEWLISSLSVDTTADAPVDAPRYTASKAFVSGGRLGAWFDEALVRLPLWFGGLMPRTFDVDLQHVQLSCKVEETSSTWKLSGCTLGGTWPVGELFGGLSASANPLNPSEFICTDSDGYGFFKKSICNYAGWSLESSACDAMSVGVRFETTSAVASNVFEETPAEPSCAMGVDPGDDTCE